MFSSLSKYSSCQFPPKNSLCCTISYQQCNIIQWYISYSTLTCHNTHCDSYFFTFLCLLAKNTINYDKELFTLHWCHSRQENAYMNVLLLTKLAFEFPSFTSLLISSMMLAHQHKMQRTGTTRILICFLPSQYWKELACEK